MKIDHCDECWETMVRASVANAPAGVRRHAAGGLCVPCYVEKRQRDKVKDDPERDPLRSWDGDGPGAWLADGMCAQTDPEIFHPTKGRANSTAKKICAACPVLRACRDYAINNSRVSGIWGGMSDLERRKARQEQAA